VTNNLSILIPINSFRFLNDPIFTMHIARRKVIKALGLLAGVSLAGALPGTLSGRTAASAFEKSFILGKKGRTQAILLGADQRGNRFGKYALRHPEDFSIIALSENRAMLKNALSAKLSLPNTHRFKYWKQVFEHPKFADVVIVTQKGDLTDVCSAALRAGYDVWVDRPATLIPSRMDALNALARKLGRQLLFVYGFPEQLCFMELRCTCPEAEIA